MTGYSKTTRVKFIRPILFCALCALVLALTSGMIKDLHTEWNQHILLALTISMTYLLTLFFSKWEGLPIKQMGVVAHRTTLKKVALGFGIGLVLAMLQSIFLVCAGHYKISLDTSVPLYYVFFYLTLYLLVAVREELAFRGYPLAALYRSYGFWISQLMMSVLFSLEHMASGMTLVQAFLGAGTGALLFGFAAIRTKGIALPIGLHTAWNFGQWGMGLKTEAGLFYGMVDQGYEPVVDRNGWMGYLLVMVVAIASFYWYRPGNDGPSQR